MQEDIISVATIENIFKQPIEKTSFPEETARTLQSMDQLDVYKLAENQIRWDETTKKFMLIFKTMTKLNRKSLIML